MNAKHTAGPWHLKHNHPANAGEFTKPDGLLAWRIVRVATPCGDFVVTGENDTSAAREANAQLIAAAPDLLAALQSLVSSKDSGEQALASQWACARLAISKAIQ